MSRDYRIIRNGRFVGDSFNVNISGAIWLGELFKQLGLPVSPVPGGFETVPHEITGAVASAIRVAIQQPDFPERITNAIIKVREELPADSAGMTVEQERDWSMQFLRMANNAEGFASDYCEQYITP